MTSFCKQTRNHRICKQPADTWITAEDKKEGAKGSWARKEKRGGLAAGFCRARAATADGICVHCKRKSDCRECGGSVICSHGKRKSDCRECGGSSICRHGKLKSQCRECGRSPLTSVCKQTTKQRKCKHPADSCTAAADKPEGAIGSGAEMGKGGGLAAGVCRARAAAAAAESAQAEAAAAGLDGGGAGTGGNAQRVLGEAHRLSMRSLVLQ